MPIGHKKSPNLGSQSLTPLCDRATRASRALSYRPSRATAAHTRPHVPWHACASTVLNMRLPDRSRVLLDGRVKAQ